jgi:hypothetical protein
MKRIIMVVAVVFAFCCSLSQAQTVSNYVEYGDEDLCNTGTYSSDPKAGATLIGLAPDVVTHSTSSFNHSFPFSPTVSDYPGTDQIYVGSIQTGNFDGYSNAASRKNGPQVITLDYSSLVPAGQKIATLTLGIGADDFQFPNWGQPFTVMVNGKTNTVLTSAINGLNQTGPYEQFLTIGIDPSVLQSNNILTLSVDEGGNGGDGWAIDFLTVGITTVQNNLGTLQAGVGSNGNGKVFTLTLPPNINGAVLETTTNITAPVQWTPLFTNSGELTTNFPFLYHQQFFRLRK